MTHVAKFPRKSCPVVNWIANVVLIRITAQPQNRASRMLVETPDVSLTAAMFVVYLITIALRRILSLIGICYEDEMLHVLLTT